MTSRVAHHFDDAQQQFHAANLGMWVFLVTEVMFFGGLFAGYTVYRFLYPDAFAAGSARLDEVLGAVNTAVLLTSSLMMALSVHAAQSGRNALAVRFLLGTMALGVAFLGIKAHEYAEKFRHHEVPGRHFRFEASEHESDTKATQGDAGESLKLAAGGWDAQADTSGPVELFFSFYFAMTGLHALHMIIGIGIVATIAWSAHRNRYSPDYYTPVEIAGLYWHFVDIVWVFLFPLLYLIR